MLFFHRLALLALAAGGSVSAQSILEREPNDSALRANSILCGDPVYGSIGVPGDQDWFRIIVPAPTSLIIDTTSRNTGTQSGDPVPLPSITDTVLALYADDGATLIAQNDDRADVPRPERSYFSRIVASVDAGAYYVRVRGFSSAPSTTRSIGDYVLYAHCFPVEGCLGAPSPGPAEVEPNNSCATATPAACCAIYDSTCDVSGDVDFYEFSVTRPMAVTLETSESIATTGVPILDGDTRIWLYDVTCSLHSSDDDAGSLRYSRLNANLPPGTYFVEVSHKTRSGAGDYRLTITCEPLRFPSGFAYAGSGCAGSGGTLHTAMPRNGWVLVGGWLRLELYGSSLGPAVSLIGDAILPVDLSGFGAPGCELYVHAFAQLDGVPIGPNEQEMLLPVPANPSLVGAAFSQQWVELDPPANGFGLTFSGRLDVVIGEG